MLLFIVVLKIFEMLHFHYRLNFSFICNSMCCQKFLFSRTILRILFHFFSYLQYIINYYTHSIVYNCRYIKESIPESIIVVTENSVPTWGVLAEGCVELPADTFATRAPLDFQLFRWIRLVYLLTMSQNICRVNHSEWE